MLTDVRKRPSGYERFELSVRWLLARQWHRMAQEEAFVARTAEVGEARLASQPVDTGAPLVNDLTTHAWKVRGIDGAGY